jgi:hypothetical protein
VPADPAAKRRPAATRPCPPGTLAWQEYSIGLASGQTARVGLSLSNPRDRTMARVKKAHGALNLGHLVVLDDPESAEEVVLWLHQAHTLTLVARDGDTMIGREVAAVLPRYFAAFFDEIKHLAPLLSDVRLVMPRTGDRKLN